MGQRSEVPVPVLVPIALVSPSKDGTSSEKEELSNLKAGLRKVKLLTDFVSAARKAKKAFSQEDNCSDGRCPDRCKEAEFTSPFDTDSHDDDLDEGELDVNKEESFRKSFSYGTLSSANYLGGSFYTDLGIDGENEDLVYNSHRRSDVGSSEIIRSRPREFEYFKEEHPSLQEEEAEFRSPKAKGEPLLKKAYGEEVGDDIDYDHRQLSSSDESFSVEGL